MKILQLISSEGFYGAENVVAALTRDLEQAGNSVLVGVFENIHASPNNVAAQFESRGLQVVRIPCRSRFDRAAIKRIREIIRSHGIGLVHSHGYKSDIYAYFAARRLGLPLLATSHLWTRQTAAVRFYEFLDAQVLRRFDAVVAVSDRIAAELRQAGVPAGKITIIDNGIDLRPFQSAVPTLASELNKGDQLLIGTVGRLVEQKGLTFFLTAAQQLLKEFPNLLFAIFGDGPDRGKLEQMAKDLQIAEKVWFAGARRDMPNVYASLDVFALASVGEGLPMALLEAMASGVPVVATEVGAVPKVIVSGRSGMLVRPGDATQLAQAIACLLRDPVLRGHLAGNGKQTVHEQFSSRVMTQNYCRVYGQLLGEKTGADSGGAGLQTCVKRQRVSGL
jgi:glycosyltransferase involved in cell wall biosynthesis